MLNTSSGKFFICKDPIDLKKSFDGLSEAVMKIFNMPIEENIFFIFLNKRRDRMKVLYWDIDGFAIWYKRLEKGTYLIKNIDNSAIERKDFIMLLEGIEPKRLRKRFSQ
jgi:transposase